MKNQPARTPTTVFRSSRRETIEQVIQILEPSLARPELTELLDHYCQKERSKPIKTVKFILRISTTNEECKSQSQHSFEISLRSGPLVVNLLFDLIDESEEWVVNFYRCLRNKFITVTLKDGSQLSVARRMRMGLATSDKTFFQIYERLSLADKKNQTQGKSQTKGIAARRARRQALAKANEEKKSLKPGSGAIMGEGQVSKPYSSGAPIIPRKS